MTSIETIRLLILNNSRAEAERLTSMLHNAGRPSRAQHVDSEEALIKLLQEQTWDLLIGHCKTTNPTPQSALKHIRRLNKDVPVVLLFEDEENFSVIDAMKLGAVDAVHLDNDQHLLLVIQREINNRIDRQSKRHADRRFREAERRSQQLLDSSRDAIAYVQDGLFLYANESFADLFGYEDRDAIDCLPIIDMIANEDQNKLKNFLKEFSLKGDEGGASHLSLRGVMQDGTPTAINLEVSHVTYDEEPCIQFLARATLATTSSVNNEALEEQLKQIKSQDLVTGLYNRQYFLQQIEQTIDHIEDQQSLSLLYIDLDQFNARVTSTFGAAGADQVLGDVSALLKLKVNTTDLLARFSDNSFTLLIPNIKADAAVNRAHQLCKLIESHIIDIDGKTLQLTCSIGVSIINETSTNASTVIEQARTAMNKARGDHGNTAGLYEPDAPTAGSVKRDLAADIQFALDNEKFRLVFQPIISLRGSSEEYYEVYLRMLNDKNEEVLPDEFLESATAINAASKIDRWVILEAIKMLASQRAKGNKTKLIVNIGRQSLCDETLVPWLGVAFKAAKLPPEAITFQANEVDVTNHLNSAKNFADALVKLKTQMSITNFGCSLNPFNTLKHVQAALIKVDGSFTTDIQHKNESSAALIELIEKLHAENKITIVPYVENATVLSTLWQAGAHYIQGHYLQEPSQNMNYDFNMES